MYALQWRHNVRVGISNHQPHDCLLNHLFKAQIKESIKAPRHWPLCGVFTGDRWNPRTKACNAENVFNLMTSSWLFRYMQSSSQKYCWWFVLTLFCVFWSTWILTEITNVFCRTPSLVLGQSVKQPSRIWANDYWQYSYKNITTISCTYFMGHTALHQWWS